MKSENMGSDCLKCKNYCTDTKGAHVDYCKPLGVLTGENKENFPKSCGFLFNPKE